jgi:hypothetical protein
MMLFQGTAQEVLYELITYGIPRAIIPIDCDNNIMLTHFQSWFAMQAEKERVSSSIAMDPSSSSSSCSLSHCSGPTLQDVIVPGQFDVLMGRGKVIEDSSGNNHLRFLISAHYSKYDQAARVEKSAICSWIRGLIHQKGGRFLKKGGNNAWSEIPEPKAIEKISHAFRNYRSREVK